MKKIIVPLLSLLIFRTTDGAESKIKRGIDLHSREINFSNEGFDGQTVDQSSGWRGSHIPLQESPVYAQGISKYLPLVQLAQSGDNAEYNLDVDLSPSLSSSPSLSQTLDSHEQKLLISSIPSLISSVPTLHEIQSNSIEKPVDEPQEYVPPQSIGSAIIPQVPPPATPVNAAASNVPANRGAVFLGSGSLGVVHLGNGAYALGSGSLGYSDNRRQPRPSDRVAPYPPLPANPNLLPAATPSQQQPPSHINMPLLPPENTIQFPVPSIDFNHPILNVQSPQFIQPPQYPPLPQFPNQPQPQPPQFPPQPPPPLPRPLINMNPPPPPVLQPRDTSGYEQIPPERVRFGGPNPNPQRVKVTMSFATRSIQQPAIGLPSPPQNFGPNTPDINGPQPQPPPRVPLRNIFSYQ